MPLSVRNASAVDLPEVLKVCREFHASAVLGTTAHFDEASMTETLQRLISEPSGVLLVAGVGPAVDAVLGAVSAPLYFNRDCSHVVELFWYARKGARPGAGLALLKHLEHLARKSGASAIIMASLPGRCSKALSSLYRRRGYTQADTTFVKAL